MTDYTDLSLKQLIALIETLKDSSLREEQHIKEYYEAYAKNYGETVEFLRKIGILGLDGRMLVLSPRYRDSIAGDLSQGLDRTQVTKIILEAVLSSKSAVIQEIEDYLRCFRPVADRYEWRPDLSQRLEFSGLRNLLMELGLIEYVPEEDAYRINEEYRGLLEGRIRIGGGVLTPEMATKLRVENEALGLAAEHEVLTYEESRLSKCQLPGPIRWVSKEDVTLGYDICSYSLRAYNESFSDRFIEVKAVSSHDWRFFWTRSEINAARSLAENYFLYLIPVIQGRRFNISALMVIQNPYQTVFDDQGEWKRSEEIIACFREG